MDKINISVGYSKNKAVSISSGTYLCFQDIVSIPNYKD